MSRTYSRKIADMFGYEGSDRDVAFAKPRSKPERLYSLFQFDRVAERWVRISKVALPKKAAVTIFQNRLIDLSLSGEMVELRPVKHS